MNAHLSKAKMNLELVIVGGAAFILKGLVPRATFDFDFINKANSKIITMLNAEGFDVNNRVDTYFYQFGIEWDQDLETLVRLSNLIVKTMSTERLMVSRLFSNKRHEDFEESANNSDISKSKFEDVLIEVHSIAYEMSPRDFRENSYMVKELYIKKGWDYENSDIKHLCEIQT